MDKDKDNFWAEITAMLRSHRQSRPPVEQLDDERLANMQSTVFAHIDRQFEQTANHTAPSSNADTRPGIFKQIKMWFSAGTDGRTPYRTPALAFAALAVLCVGVIAYLSNSAQQTTLSPLPDSLAMSTDALKPHIQLSEQGSRALMAVDRSPQHQAFFAGVTKADLDILNDPEHSLSQALLAQYRATVGQPSDNDDSSALRRAFDSDLQQLSTDTATAHWLQHGYAVELVNLAAQSAMTSLDTAALGEALNFYNHHPADLDPQVMGKNYVEAHHNLTDMAATSLSTPAEIESVISLTRQLKILVQ